MLQKRRGLPYSITVRKLSSGAKMFYARFRGSDGTFGPAKSTGVEDAGKMRDRDKAVAWCEQYLTGGQITTNAYMTLAVYGEGFFAWDSAYAQDRILRGKRYSMEQARSHELAFLNWIKPDKIGNMRLEMIDDQAVASWQLRIASTGLAPKTVHQRTMTLRILLKAAYRTGHLRRVIQYEPISGRVKSPRGMLTIEEATRVFSEPWGDQRTYAGNLLAIVTGLRAGEVVGIRSSRVHDDHIEIVGTWRPKSRQLSDSTKGGSPRRVPVPAQVMDIIKILIKSNPWKGRVDDPYVFWSNGAADRPVAQSELTEAFHARLDVVLGFNMWRLRRLGMHSWRAFANSAYLEASVPSAMIQKTIGHTSDAMTALYYKPQALIPIRDVQTGIASTILPDQSST